MMTVKLQIVIGIAILFVFAILVNMIRRRSLELKYALSWMAVLCALFLFDCAPKLLIVVSDFLGAGEYDFFPGVLFFPGDHLFADGGAFQNVQQHPDAGSDGGSE